MKFKIRFADQIVGIFILLSLTALVAILILMGANQRWFARNYYFESRFSSANGLSVGMPITLKGFEIGKVSKISLNQGNLVDLEFYVFDTFYEKVKKNSVLELATNPLGLGGGLRFHPGLDTGSPLEESSFIPSLDQEEGKRLVEAKLVDIPVSGDAINAILGRIGPVLEGVNTTLLTINNLMDTVTGTIRGTMPGPIADIMAGAIVTVTNVNSTIDTVGSTLDSVSTSIDSTIGNVNTVVAGVNT
ncbi:MAG: MCE family protein, partial [Spirochaetales bacterium]